MFIEKIYLPHELLFWNQIIDLCSIVILMKGKSQKFSKPRGHILKNIRSYIILENFNCTPPKQIQDISSEIVWCLASPFVSAGSSAKDFRFGRAFLELNLNIDPVN